MPETSVRIVAATTEGTGTVVSIDETGEDATAADHLAEGGLPAPRPEHVHIRVSGRHPADYELAVWVIEAPDPQSRDEFDIEFRYLERRSRARRSSRHSLPRRRRGKG